MWKNLSFAVVTACALHAEVPAAQACGGFFCGRQPVDQTAERIVFKIGPDSVTMVVQIAYAGAAADFAWVLPLVEVPDVTSLGLFPQRALTALDANTSPQFALPNECRSAQGIRRGQGGSGGATAAVVDAGAEDVTVHFRAEVGPYDVAAVESQDPMALYAWLVEEDFNVNESMLPYIRAYTEAGMKFVALKLQSGKETSDIKPFRFELPGSTPSIPLRMTALAAEPEMGILVFVFGGERYNGANWPDVTIKDEQIAWRGDVWPVQTNWAALVARGVDQAGGQGWVTELAGPTTDLIAQLDNSAFSAPDDMEAGQALRDLIGDSPYVSRLYSRLSAEEMTIDPIFHKDAGSDIDNVHQLSRVVDGLDLCPDKPALVDPCLFTSCGAGGICRAVMLAGIQLPVAGCGCLDGTSARTTFSPVSASPQAGSGAGRSAAVVCQDMRLSFVNPGDTMASGEVMDDPCLGFDCGQAGRCAAVNMTPTCICDQGHVAVGSFNADATRKTTCEKPMLEVPKAFYSQRLPDLPAGLPGGLKLEVDSDRPVVQPNMNDLGSHLGALPASMGTAGTGGNGASGDDSGCSISAVGSKRIPGWACAAALFTTCALALRRRSRR